MNPFRYLIQKIFFPNLDQNRLKGKSLEKSIPTGKELRYRALQKIFSILVEKEDFEEMTQMAVDLMAQEMDYFGGALLLHDEEQKGLVTWVSTDSTTSKAIKKWLKNPLRKYVFPLSSTDSYMVKTFTEDKLFESQNLSNFVYPVVDTKFINRMTEFLGMRSSIAFPIKYQGKKIGVAWLASPRQKASEDEIDMLETFSHQLAIAINNAKSFEKINTQYHNLEERYRDLEMIKEVTSQVARTNDLTKLSQFIVDYLFEKLQKKEFGLVIANISLRDLHTNVLTPISVSKNSPWIKKIELGINMPISSFTIDLNNITNSKIKKAIDERQLQICDNIQDFLGDNIDHKVFPIIDSLLPYKSVVIFPFFTRDRFAGMLNVVLSIAPDQIKTNNLWILQTIANELAIAVDNLTAWHDLQEANLQLHLANEKLKLLDKSKTEFLSIASHQLRTPLTAIKGYLSMVEEGDFGPLENTKVTEVIHKSLENTKRLAVLVNDLLSLARIESGANNKTLNLVEFSFQDLFKEIEEEVILEAQNKKLELTFTSPPKPVIVTQDKEKISQVIMNLVENAVHYTETGQVKVNLEIQDPHILITIKDSGIGISQANKDKMFTKFYRGDNARKSRPDGSGIGLYVVKTMVKQHGGDIWFESQENQGTTFFVKLPIKAAPESPLDQAPPSAKDDYPHLLEIPGTKPGQGQQPNVVMQMDIDEPINSQEHPTLSRLMQGEKI